MAQVNRRTIVKDIKNILRELPKRCWLATMQQGTPDLFCVEIRAKDQEKIVATGYGALPRAICLAIQGLPGK